MGFISTLKIFCSDLVNQTEKGNNEEHHWQFFQELYPFFHFSWLHHPPWWRWRWIWIGIGVEGSKLFEHELKNNEDTMDIVAMIRNVLSSWLKSSIWVCLILCTIWWLVSFEIKLWSQLNYKIPTPPIPSFYFNH